MKQQISRFSPHQNAKVLAVLMAVGALVFLVPFMLLSYAFAPQQQHMPFMFLLVMPLFYLVVGYLMAVVGCWLYNALFRWIGGIEFEARPPAA